MPAREGKPVPQQATFLCLANSRKPPNGRCVAGKVIANGAYQGWIRPVSARQSREVSEEERRFQDGRDPQVLDVVRVMVDAHVPSNHQTENWEIDDRFCWEYAGRTNWAQTVAAVDAPPTLWVNGHHTFNGMNDKVPAAQVSALNNSLYLVRPEDLRLAVVTEGAAFNNPRRRLRAHFRYGGVHYTLLVTDPVVERQYFAVPGDYEEPVADALLCVSLTDLHTDGFAYKLVASLITPVRAATP